MTNSEFKIMLEKRTVAFSIATIKMLRNVPAGYESRNIRDQLLRSATAIGANYREANRAESNADFAHKLAISTKECAETEYWLIILSELYPETKGLMDVLAEATKLTGLFGKALRSLAHADPRT